MILNNQFNSPIVYLIPFWIQGIYLLSPWVCELVSALEWVWVYLVLGVQLEGKKIWGLAGEGVRWVRLGGWAPTQLGVLEGVRWGLGIGLSPLDVLVGVRWLLGIGLPPLDVVVFVGVGVRFRWFWLLVISSIMWLAWKLSFTTWEKYISLFSSPGKDRGCSTITVVTD